MPAVRCSHASTNSTPATLCGSAEDVSSQVCLFVSSLVLAQALSIKPALQTLCWSCSGLTLLYKRVYMPCKVEHRTKSREQKGESRSATRTGSILCA